MWELLPRKGVPELVKLERYVEEIRSKFRAYTFRLFHDLIFERVRDKTLMENYIMYHITGSMRRRQTIAARLYNRYTVLILLLVVMLVVHINLIQIHPLMFIVWPASAWLAIEIYSKWKRQPFRVLLFTATFTVYILITQFLVVENTSGIFFDLEPFPNMATISNIVLGISATLFFYDTLIEKGVSFRNVPVYVGFASVIPWGSPVIVEAVILARWILNGSFNVRTMGKGLGAASVNDILFVYGSRNLAYTAILFYSTLSLIRFTELIATRMERERQRRHLLEIEREWHVHAWENPLSLLSPSEQISFIKEHSHLGAEKRNEILRKKILPGKGIRLNGPDINFE